MKINHYPKLAAAWLAATKTQSWEDFEAFASALNAECCRQAPQRRFQGFMAGAEREVQQDTCLMLLGKYLINNPNLVGEEDAAVIEYHLIQSVRICTRYAIARIARQRSCSRQFPATDESIYGMENHPRCKTYSDLTFEEKRAMALSALQLAVEQTKLSDKNVQVARLILEEGLSHREAAQKLGVTASAISQQIKLVAAQLAVLKEAVEVEVK